MAKDKPVAARYAHSERLFERALSRMPGGVSSPVRSGKAVGMHPVYMKQAHGAQVTDVDGNTYIDYIMSYGPLIAGHTPQPVRAAAAKQIDRGSTFGCCTEEELKLADMIAAAMPHVPMIRFVNSGTEAVMSALRLARGATGRTKIVKCAGCYHGHSDPLLVQAGSGALTFGTPSSPGVSESTVSSTLVTRFNDAAAAEAIFAAHGPDIAAMIVEPICGNMGVVLPRPGYLQVLRDLCNSHGALLVMDEVMTGFRVAYGGAQSLYGVRADITCLGKIIGGGMPVGAYGGRAELMNQISPAGPIYQAGTLSGNPLAMAAGAATLALLESTDVYSTLENLGKRLESGLIEAASDAGVRLAVQRSGSMITPFFLQQAGGQTPAEAPEQFFQQINNFDQAIACDTGAYGVFYRAMLDSGVLLPPSQFEAWFLSTAHTEEHIDTTLLHAAKALEAVQAAATAG